MMICKTLLLLFPSPALAIMKLSTTLVSRIFFCAVTTISFASNVYETSNYEYMTLAFDDQTLVKG